MFRIVVKPLAESLAFYRTRHLTTGCKITHMIGIPMLLAVVPTSFSANASLAAILLIGGIVFQFSGHWIFEKNEPTLMETHDLMTIPASIVFCAEQWRDVFVGKWLRDNGCDLWAKRPST